ncbi:methyltransferase small domain protein [Methyloversatilis sp. RAC08]|uniref:cyclopropane fatty acyl phospholipid synthase n=1 Tax=Methyloversatilis sp. RAC08 TaxID=1842540 RepID=UPI00083CE78A|nr:cyclopropane fatty acyl phospholipid synthase [Methyloversatilis sp. RAC08]AOF83295.1 methyltransferase small domain protein [Methyloversatilis sp. RAC08]
MLREALFRGPPQDDTRSSKFRVLSGLLAQAGIEVDGPEPWDMRIHSPDLPARLLAQGSLGLGESYMDGEWDADQLDEFFARLLRARLGERVQPARIVMHALSAHIFNRQTRRRAWQVGERHYDLGNDFYAAMLDPRMTYTCAYWKNADDLASAQEAKLDLVCRKLKLEPGMRLLDIGCGWGSLIGYAAEHYGVECVGVTVSREQVEWARARYARLPVEFRLQDYREVDEAFDRVASIGMFEHVGRKNFRTFMQVARRCLHPDGLLLLHTIGKNTQRGATDPWIDRYIFPNGDLPAVGQIGRAVDDLFVVEDLHNFGADYDRTLMAWHANFEAAWPQLADRLGERFRRMWRYYLLSCAGAFRARDIQLWQWVLSPAGVPGGYRRIN